MRPGILQIEPPFCIGDADAPGVVEMKADARSAGLTDPDIDAELAAYNAERRNPPASE